MFPIGLMRVRLDDNADALAACGSYLRDLGAVVTAAREVRTGFECFHSRRDSNPQD